MTDEATLSADALMQRACVAAGVPDFGDFAFVPALEKYVESINGILGGLLETGKKDMEDRIVRLLVNRLRMKQAIRQHPEIHDEEILPPVAIFGLPRTGSTKLQRMLAAGGYFQEILMWQGYNPAPFPDADPRQRDPRIQDAADYIESIMKATPGFHKGHTMIVEEPEEESMLLEQTFQTIYAISFMPVFSWCKYIERLDKTDMYAHLRESLQYLQWQFHKGERKPWLLKYPPNLGYESYISRVFPGAKYIITHRDPFSVLASLSQLTTSHWLLYCKDRDIKRFSRWALEEFASQMERHMAWRDARPDVEILDLSFNDIVTNGLEVAKRAYAFLDKPWTPEVEQKINVWLKQNEQQKDKLEWSFDDIDYSEAECRQYFRDYYRRFSNYL